MSASAVLLLHGQPGGGGDWDGVIARLDGRVCTLAADRPGWDGSSPACDLDGNARWALAQLDARGIDRAIVVGHSFGGAVAAWVAATRPQRVAALVLAAPAANLASLYALDRWLAAPLVGELAGGLTMAGAGLLLSLPGLRRRVARITGLDPAYLGAARQAALRPAAWRSFATEQRALIRDLPALDARLAQITAPTTILAGGEDRIVPARAARALARQIPGARLIVSDHAGHLLPQHDPGLIAEAVLDAAERVEAERMEADGVG